ncbi:MAG: zf-HC2 domain-containing protein [Saprospiraceae bacterium]|nr:zf-HC2 domain-containing protein [Saprospiraceae bacterium]
MSEHVHTPHCKQLLGNLSEYIDGDLQAELCAEIEAHLKDCDNCRVVINTLKKTVELYQQTGEPVGLPDAVRERLFMKLELKDFLKKD